MAIHVDVVTQLDERAVALTARQLEQHFTGVTPRFQQAARDATNAFANELNTGVNAAVAGAASNFGALGRAATPAMQQLVSGASAAALGIAGIGVAAVAVGKQFYDLGAQWDSISDNLIIRTGAVGAELDSLTAAIGDIGKTTAASLESIGNVVGQISQALPNVAANNDALRQLGSNLAFLGEHGQQVNIRELGMAFNVFGVNAADATRNLDNLQRVSQATGIPINELIATLRQGAPQFRQFGLDISQSTSLLASFQQAGLSPQLAVTGLRLALRSVADDARGAGPALADVITQIKALYDAGNLPAAQELAKTTFGYRNFAPFLEAIETGTLDAQKLKTAMDEVGLSIENMKQLTDDNAEAWTKLVNTLKVELKPAADTVFTAINSYAQLTSGNFAGFFNPLKRADDKLAEMVEHARQLAEEAGKPIDPNSALGRMLAPAGVVGAGGPGAPQGGGIGGGTQPGLTGVGPNGELVSPGGLLSPQWGAGNVPPPSTGGGGGPKAPAVPYPADYGQILPGETPEQTHRRFQVIEDQHAVDEAQARVNQLKSANVKDENAIIEAENRLAQAKARQLQDRDKAVKLETPQVPYPAGYGAPPRPGETAEQYGKEQSALTAIHGVAEAEAALQQLRGSGTATPDQLTQAENNLNKAREQEYEALLRLNESSSKASDSLGDVGVKLDQDFGLSRGLPGLAENLVRFLGNLAFAPAIGAMRGVQAGLGYPGGQNLGGGLIGMGAAAGLFGPQFQGGGGNNGGAFPGGYPSGYPNQYPVQYPGGGNTPYPGPYPQASNAAAWSTDWDAIAQGESGGNWQIPSDSSGAPFRGGLQILDSTWKQYGGDQFAPTANLASPDQQKTVAERILHGYNGIPGQGGGAWPNTFGLGGGIRGGFATGLPNAAIGYGLDRQAAAQPFQMMRQPYGLPGGTNIPAGGQGFPPWVYALGARFGLQPSTYPGHQATQRPDIGASANPLLQNRGIDWTGPMPNQDAFAQFLVQSGLAEMVIHQDPNSGQRWGYPGFVDYSGNYGQETNMVHTRFGASVPMFPGFASGGAVPIVAHGGEHVLTQADVNAMGGQAGVYAFRRSLHYQDGGPVPPQGIDIHIGTGAAPGPAPAPPPAPGGPPTIGGVPAPLGLPGPPPPVVPGVGGPTQIGGVAPPEGYGAGFSITGGGLIGILESLPASAINYAISAAATAGVAAGGAAAAQYGGAIEDLPSFQEGGAVGGASAGGGGGAGGGGAAGGGGDIAGTVIAAAINIAISEINRAIGFAGQAAGIGVSGLMQTFLPTAGSQLAQNNWITRFLGGIIGAHPNLPNISLAQGRQQSMLTPEQILAMAPPMPPGAGIPGQTAPHGLNAGAAPGPPQIGVQIQNYNVSNTEDRAGQDIARWNMPGQR